MADEILVYPGAEIMKPDFLFAEFESLLDFERCEIEKKIIALQLKLKRINGSLSRLRKETGNG